jgi:ketosteroid isomerase-like protein
VAAATPTAAAPAGEGSPRAEILALIESFRTAYERKDLTAVMALFGTEARDRNVTGRQAVEQLYVRNFAALDGIRYDLAQLGVKAPAGSGDLVVEGRFRIRATHLTGKPRPMDVAGPIRWLLRRENGALRIVAIEYETPAR